MSVIRQLCDVCNGIAGVGACSKGRAADIDGVCTVVDRLNAEINIFCRREKFDTVALCVHWLGSKQGSVL